MKNEESEGERASEKQDWRKVVGRYKSPNHWYSIWQLINSIIPFIAIWILMVYSLNWSYWITLALAFPAAGFMVRIFIIFHDCGHKSFFKAPHWNEWVGFVTGLFSFTPYHKWHRSHNKHHATVGNLDKRGVGDVMTMTVQEFKNASKGRQLFYRLYRHPLIMLGIGAPYIFIIQNRLFARDVQAREKRNVIVTNLTLLAIIVGLSFWIGFTNVLIIQLPILYIASIWGTWLFYMQHQFEGVHWYRDIDWDFETVALYGSSFYKLPRVIQWFSGNIGFHHVNHLSSRIPNYKLEKCHRENSLFSQVKPVTLGSSVRSLKLRLWDEDKAKLVNFKQI